MYSLLKISFVIVLISIVLTGCLNNEPDAEPVRSVDWYSENSPEREAKIKECANNPGQLSDSPNCINALQAERIESVGTLR